MLNLLSIEICSNSHRKAGGLKPKFRAAVLSAAAALLVASAPTSAYSQAYPAQPIRLIVPFNPGGGVDIIARTISEAITKHSGHTVVVENRTGAGGNVASQFVARATPDGYTVLVGSNSNSYNDFLYSSIGYDPANDLRRVVQIGRVPMVLLVSPTIEPKSVNDVIGWAKARPGEANFGSGGNGTAEHLIYELFKRRADIQATHVPYRGGAATYTDLMSGVIQFMFNNQLGAMPHVRSGQLRAVGLAGPERSTQLPDLPTFAEQGMPNFNAAVWWGLMVPAATPDKVVADLNRIVNGALETKEVRARLESLGAQPVGGPAQQFEAFFASERSMWKQVIQDAKIKLE